MKSITIASLIEKMQSEKTILIDVREKDEYESGHIPTAHSIPLSMLEDYLTVLDKKESYYLICQSGGRSARACEMLESHGFDVTNVEGGTLAWPGKLEF